MQRNRALGRETARPARARARRQSVRDAPITDDLVREQLRERLFEMLLHRRAVELALPAVEAGAVVLDDETDVAHVPGVYQKCASMPTVPVF